MRIEWRQVMNIKGTPWSISISKNAEKTRWYDFGEGWKTIDDNDVFKSIKFDELRSKIKSAKSDEEIVNTAREYRKYFVSNNAEVDKTTLCEAIINFFSEFHFEPNYRFINTLANTSLKGESSMRDYIVNYFTLIDSPYVSSIKEKMRSAEFSSILSDLQSIEITNVINKRFKLYYGSQGTGKTTQAINESDECMVCHSAILPQDLMEDFKFENGQPSFTGSAFKDAMVNGKTIVLDEINLLPFETVRFLQSVLDGKSEFVYKGEVVHIHENFKVIGTMNLIVNGAVFGLPEPLVDRAEELKEFKLTSDKLCYALN